MSHWAEVNDKNTVVNVVVGDNNDPNGDEGYQWLIENLGGRWIKTSYNTYGGEHILGGTPLRKNFAGIDYIYDEIKDAFIPPKPPLEETLVTKKIVDWELNDETCLWERKVVEPS
jgi:hypothetical protein